MTFLIKPKTYKFEDIKEAKNVIDALNSKMSSDNSIYFMKFYIFNFCRAIELRKFLLVEKLINHDAFLITKQNIVCSLARKALETNNYILVKMFFPYVKFLKEVVENRNSFLDKNTCPFSALVKKPFLGISINNIYYYAVDKIISIEDILDDNTEFKKFTGISFEKKEDIEKIEKFLGEKIEKSDKKLLKKLVSKKRKL